MDKGKIIWLSSSGKTTLGNELEAYLKRECSTVQVLDDDKMRFQTFTSDKDFSMEGSWRQIRRMVNIALFLASNGITVICTFVTPLVGMRLFLKDYLKDLLILVHVTTPLDICVKRDVKSLYRKALYGEINDMTGINQPFEEDTVLIDDIRVSTNSSITDSLNVIITHLERLFDVKK